MINKIWGKKIGMTQVFSSDNYKAIPVTVVSLGEWIVLQRKTSDNDGYESVQVGSLRNKYKNKEFSLDWLKKKKKHFIYIKEIKCNKEDVFEVGSFLKLSESLFEKGEKVSVSGKTTGKGFQGVVKRHGFSGGPGSHSDGMGRTTGALGGSRTHGMVYKGKKMPGHMGYKNRTVKNKIIDYKIEDNILILKGAISGRSGSLVCIEKG